MLKNECRSRTPANHTDGHGFVKKSKALHLFA
jgi:hypothetical protein